jgi:hypothetical protein
MFYLDAGQDKNCNAMREKRSPGVVKHLVQCFSQFNLLPVTHSFEWQRFTMGGLPVPKVGAGLSSGNR